MYKEYMKERQLCEFIECTDSHFVSYRIEGNVCYLQDMYITPKYRKQGLSKSLVGQLELIAKKKKCKFLITTINLGCNGDNTINQKTASSNGFTEKVRSDDGIYYLKEI